MKKILLIIFIFSSFGAFAQNTLVNFQYSIGFGTGDLGDYITQPSFRGFTFDYRSVVNENVGVGLEFAWNVFYQQEDFGTYTKENLSLTGKQWRYNNQLPMLVAADYYLSPGETFNPFVGLGIGTMYSRRNTDMSTYTLEEEAWHFVLRPEAGFIYEVSPDLGLSATAKYYIGFEAGDLPTQSYITLNFGVVFMPF
jgi:opacity protein-like surface antigen